jgi:Zn-dependent M32 family carboxypeptidase
MSEKLEKLKTLLGEVNDIGRASAVLGWDQQVNMPRRAGSSLQRWARSRRRNSSATRSAG